MWAMIVAAALAGELPVWDADRYPRYQDIGGRDGWENGFEGDAWFGVEGGEWAASAADASIEDTRGDRYGSGWAADNWLVNGDVVGDGRVTALGATDDDDTIGLVYGLDGGDTLYLAGWSSDSLPPPYAERASRETIFLIRIQDGVAELLAEDRVESDGEGHSFDLSVNDGEIVFEVDDRYSLEVTDPAALGPGQAGFYAYNAGYDGQNGSTYAAFDWIEVTAFDDDDDDVADDIDNCEFVANDDQADGDNDGLGDACEPPPPEDTDVAPDDTDPLTSGEEELSVGGCGCDGASPVGGFGGLALGLALALRRRR